MFQWKDPYDQTWLIQANPQCITLRSDKVQIYLPREQWPEHMWTQKLDQAIILRFSSPDGDAGFLMAPQSAAEFFQFIQFEPDTHSDSTNENNQQRLGIPPPPDHPKVTKQSILCIVLAVLSFIPGIGVLSGIASIVCGLLTFRKTPRENNFRHARTMAGIGLTIAIIGIATSVLGLYCLNERGWPAQKTLLPLLMGPKEDNPIFFYILIFGIVLISLSFHECGHAISALWMGDSYAQKKGRCTINPIAHIDIIGTILMPLVLAYLNGPIFGYAKPVPVRSMLLPDPRKAGMLTAIAGPSANVLLAFVAFGLYLAIGCLLHLLAPGAEIRFYSSLSPWVEIAGFPGATALSGIVLVLKLTMMINIGLAFFNLLPIPPLDGHWLITGLFPNSLGKIFETVRPYSMFIVFGLLYMGALEWLGIPLFELMYRACVTVAACTGL